MGIAFQNPDHQLFSDSVENEVSFALRNFGFPQELVSKRLDWALNFFGLEQYRKSSPLVLSGGEKKRLTLACILAWDPEVVVLDEPTVGQDSLQKEKLAQVFRMLQSTGKTIIIVSHDVEFLWPIQPRLLVMSGGKVVADGRDLQDHGGPGAPRGREGHAAPAAAGSTRGSRAGPRARSWTSQTRGPGSEAGGAG